MAKIVFFCIPAQGHTNPTLGVVRELIAQGNDVTYYSYQVMGEQIRETGAKFAPCDAYDPQVRLSKEDSGRLGKDLAFSTELIVDLTLALDDAILADMQALQPDVIVADSMAFWGKLIARKLDIPFVSSTTTFAFNQYSARVIKQSSPGLFSMLRSMPQVNKSLRRLRDKGYPVKSVLELIANDNETSTIVYTSPLFQPCSETFSDRYAFVGPILRAVREPLEPSDLPTVYISLGTVDNDHPEFYGNCLKAVAGQPYRAIISVGQDTDIFGLGEIPSNCVVRHTVDQIAVLQQADVFVTHCGMNSVSEALYYAVPLVLFPQTPEQQGVANRVREFHAGLFLADTSPETIRQTIQTALERQEFKEGAAAIQKSFHACGGAGEAADLIQRQCKTI